MIPLLLTLVVAPPELIGAEQGFALTGESTGAGWCSTAVVPAPDAPPGTYTVKATWRLSKHVANDWLDVAVRPAPPLDLSAGATVRLWVRAEQPTGFLTVKIVDPDNPGANHSALETSLLDDGRPLPAGEWVALDLKLPDDPGRRDGIKYLGFYVACSNRAVPLDTDLVFHLGRFEYVLPERPPWPPEPEGRRSLEPVPLAPLAPGGMWSLVGGRDNQTDHLAAFVDGGVEFDADAEGWNEFLWSDPAKLVLQPATTYRLEYDYTIRREAGGGSAAIFYQLVRARGTIRKDVGWQRWNAPAGSTGRRVITFTTLEMPGYYLIWGIRHHGRIRIDHIRLSRVAMEGEQP